MKLLPYSEGYKESTTVWTTSFPRHWQSKRLGSLLKERGEVNHDYSEQNVLSVLRDIGVIPYADKGNVGNKKSEDIARYKIVRPNDIVLNSMNVIIGSVGRSRYQGCLSPVYYVLTPRSSELTPEFAESIFQVKPFQQSLIRIGYGILAHRMRIPMELLKSEVLPVPPLAEQEQIVRFVRQLDSRVNRLIKAKRRLIELLNEQKQAIIHQAVTRGLDPTVPLKPSGIDWLGEVPAHWNVARLRTLATKFGSGVTPRGGAQGYVDDGIPLLRSQNIHFDGLRLENVARIPLPVHEEMSGSHVQPHDVLLNITGASLGRVCSVPDECGEMNVNQHVCIIRPKRALIHSTYLAMVLGTPSAQDELDNLQNGASREGLPLRAIKGLAIPVPPIEDQKAIQSAVSLRTSTLRQAILKAQSEIELIREYRTRLVADVVTGQLDVRQHPWANTEIEDPTEPIPDDAELEDDLEETEDVLEEAGV